ncbi:MAG: hypothetical protein K8F25_11695 [Fimbriimonadaceae bacterium]|nr:hypothetical protein [Alphaproteobacteria bacterium]
MLENPATGRLPTIGRCNAFYLSKDLVAHCVSIPNGRSKGNASVMPTCLPPVAAVMMMVVVTVVNRAMSYGNSARFMSPDVS